MPSFLRSDSPPMTCNTSSMPSSSTSSRCASPAYSRATSCDISTIHHRRTMMRASSGVRSPPPPPLHGFADFFQARTVAPVAVPATQESDTECWVRMLALQREYHCYKSARLEAAVEALESGFSIEEVPMPSRLCLDLLNAELQAKIEAHHEGLIP